MLTFDNYTEPEYRINSDGGVIIGRTAIMLNLFQYLNRLADLPTTVLLRGETGTGKELCARALHHNGSGDRKRHNFVAVNCGGIPSELLESELFGYVKGAFTGALHDTLGKFQHAGGGTILLDEIGDMDASLQVKLLRALQEKQITRVGSTQVENVDARVIAATNRNLEEEIENGNFREDLYYRLNVVPIKVPSLSERRDDIPLIAASFVERFNGVYGAQIEALAPSAQEKLKEAEWNGNVRELENVIERAFVLKRDGMIEADDLHFNSEMPTSIFIPQESANVQLRATRAHEEPEEKLWYEDGVLPITPTLLKKFQGAKSVPTIRGLIDRENDKLYVENFLDEGGRKFSVIYITPRNVGLFFRDTTTDDYRKLEREIREGEFNQVVTTPFKIYVSFDLLSQEGTLSSSQMIKSVAEQMGAYEISTGRISYYAVTLDNAHYFISQKSGTGQNVDALKSQVIASYERFNNWSPK